MAGSDSDNAMKSRAIRVPERQVMLSRMVEQLACILRSHGKISNPKRDGARRQGQGSTQRQGVPSCLSLLYAHFGGAHRLFRKSLQPQHARKIHARRYAQVGVEANNIRIALAATDVRSKIAGRKRGENALEMTTRSGLVSDNMPRHSHHSLAEQLIGRDRSGGCQIMEQSRERQRSTIPTARIVVRKQAPESA